MFPYHAYVYIYTYIPCIIPFYFTQKIKAIMFRMLFIIVNEI